MYCGLERIVVILLLKEFVFSNSLCPKNRFRPGTKLHFTDRSPSNIRACAQRYLEISCCIEGYDQVHWEQFREGAWHNFSDVRMCRELGNDDHQTAIFTCPSPGSRDPGSYRCIGTSPEGLIENEFNIDIIDCMNWDQPPWAFTPVDKVTRLDYRLFSNLSIPCRAFYGNSMNVPCLQKIRWMKIAPGGLYNISEGNSSQRVYTETHSELDESTCDSVLHIEGVEKSDYGNYLCLMENPKGKTERMVILQQYRSYYEIKNWVYWTILISAGTMLGAVVFVIMLVWRFKPELKLILGDMIQKVRKQNRKFDFMVFASNSSDQDMRMSGEIHELIEREYRCVDGGNIDYGRGSTPVLIKLTMLQKWNPIHHLCEYCLSELRQTCHNVVNDTLTMAGQSNRIIIIFSPDFLADPGCLFSLTKIVTYRCIFLLRNITTDKCCRFCPLENKLRTNDGKDVQSLVEKEIWSAIKYRCKVPLPSILNNEEGEIFWKNLKRLLPKRGEHRAVDEKAPMLNAMKHKHSAQC